MHFFFQFSAFSRFRHFDVFDIFAAFSCFDSFLRRFELFYFRCRSLIVSTIASRRHYFRHAIFAFSLKSFSLHAFDIFADGFDATFLHYFLSRRGFAERSAADFLFHYFILPLMPLISILMIAFAFTFSSSLRRSFFFTLPFSFFRAIIFISIFRHC